jgi:hypothetical protein
VVKPRAGGIGVHHADFDHGVILQKREG